MDIYQNWIQQAAKGWLHAKLGDYEAAHGYYQQADDLDMCLGTGEVVRMNPDLAMLRHRRGKAEGIVRPLPPDENVVVTLAVRDGDRTESPDALDMLRPEIDPDQIRMNITKCINAYDPGFHAENIQAQLPHIQVLATGRCGTVSLYHLMERTRYLAFHTFFHHVNYYERYEQACRLMSGNFNDQTVADEWVSTRAAEWLGAINIGRPMMGLNHLDTVFAPIFAKLHPQSRFIYLRRNPLKVFESFYDKEQWSHDQVNPVYYTFDPTFRWRYMRYDLPVLIAWYIRFTDVMARAFGEVMGNRFIELSSDRLFAKDGLETLRLINFCELSLTKGQVRDHFTIPYNQKAHKHQKTPEQMERGRAAFLHAYHTMGGDDV